MNKKKKIKTQLLTGYLSLGTYVQSTWTDRVGFRSISSRAVRIKGTLEIRWAFLTRELRQSPALSQLVQMTQSLRDPLSSKDHVGASRVAFWSRWHLVSKSSWDLLNWQEWIQVSNWHTKVYTVKHVIKATVPPSPRTERNPTSSSRCPSGPRGPAPCSSVATPSI